MPRLCLALLLAVIAAVPATAETRVALVIGASNYVAVAPLSNPANDAKSVAQSLRASGFEVTEVIDPDLSRFAQALTQFRAKANVADVALVYYAGHGVEVGKTNWLLPVSVNAETPDDLELAAIPSSAVISVVQRARSVRLVILDACRNNPFERKRGWSGLARGASGGGLGRENSGNVVVLFATQAGETAADGKGRPNSPFATSLAKLMREPGLRLASLGSRISRDVLQTTKQDQAPDQMGILDEPDWMFVPERATAAVPRASLAPQPSDPANAVELAAWDLCSRSQTAAPCEKYRMRYPTGRFVELAGDRIQELSRPASTAAQSVTRNVAAPQGALTLTSSLAHLPVKAFARMAVQTGKTSGLMIILVATADNLFASLLTENWEVTSLESGVTCRPNWSSARGLKTIGPLLRNVDSSFASLAKSAYMSAQMSLDCNGPLTPSDNLAIVARVAVATSGKRIEIATFSGQGSISPAD